MAQRLRLTVSSGSFRVLARKRVRVPAYAESFAAMLGPNSEQRLIADIEQTASGVNSLGRSLFESWVAQLLN
jgi:hypothetical protein